MSSPKYSESSRCFVLNLKVHSASLLRSLSKFGKMNPYVKVEWSKQL